MLTHGYGWRDFATSSSLSSRHHPLLYSPAFPSPWPVNSDSRHQLPRSLKSVSSPCRSASFPQLFQAYDPLQELGPFATCKLRLKAHLKVQGIQEGLQAPKTVRLDLKLFKHSQLLFKCGRYPLLLSVFWSLLHPLSSCATFPPPLFILCLPTLRNSRCVLYRHKFSF